MTKQEKTAALQAEIIELLKAEPWVITFLATVVEVASRGPKNTRERIFWSKGLPNLITEVSPDLRKAFEGLAEIFLQ